MSYHLHNALDAVFQTLLAFLPHHSRLLGYLI